MFACWTSFLAVTGTQLLTSLALTHMIGAAYCTDGLLWTIIAFWKWTKKKKKNIIAVVCVSFAFVFILNTHLRIYFSLKSHHGAKLFKLARLPTMPKSFQESTITIGGAAWLSITVLKQHTFISGFAAATGAGAAIPSQHAVWEIKLCGEKGRWDRTCNPSYIQGSNYLYAPPLCLKWILRSQKWRISTFHPSYLLYVLFLLCHSRACVINLLSAHANRTL